MALLNPKTTVFFLAFLPQFMSPGAHAGQALILGGLFVAIAAVTDALYALDAGTLAPRLQRVRLSRRGGRVLMGCTFTALAGTRRPLAP